MNTKYKNVKGMTKGNGHPMHRAQVPLRNHIAWKRQEEREENKNGKTIHYAKENKFGKKQEGTNKR